MGVAIQDHYIISNFQETMCEDFQRFDKFLSDMYIFKPDYSFVCMFNSTAGKLTLNPKQCSDWIRQFQLEHQTTSYQDPSYKLHKKHNRPIKTFIYSAPIFYNEKLCYHLVCSFDEPDHSSLLQVLNLLSKLLSFKIVSQRKAEDVFLKSEYQQQISDVVKEGYFTINQYGEVMYLNTFGAKILGIKDPSEVEGTPLSTMIDFHEQLFSVIQTGKGWIDKEFFISSKGKMQRHLILSAIPIIDDRKRLVGAIFPFREMKTLRNMVADYVGKKGLFQFADILYTSKKMENLIQLSKAAAITESSILIEGESGTGKELLAQAIHSHSNRKQNPFIVIDCSSIPRDLAESELFGYVEGAFTGARKGGKLGKFELANEGTVFLDEIGELPLELQAKLLRVIQSRTIMRVGGTDEIPIDFRVIAATNRNLEQEVNDGNFRLDLFYRLNVLHLTVPPLRDRPEDINVLAHNMLEKIARKRNKSAPSISPEIMNVLQTYSWTGNIRELENVMERCYLLAEDRIEWEHLPDRLLKERQTKRLYGNMYRGNLLQENEYELIAKMLEQTNGNKSLTAEKLGISRSTLYDKLRRYNIL
ncbi:sigma 54-interacting transcriptional regulator [Sporosarcina sp. ACRSM]|uniref:sigma-54 interaction domain-containing protein n=1 Tax=Sporosarcina sp. ACRSM TaxID=2918216 RepID=UPI001EF54D79|nr:sigma 54-interacting transcriptional regulator [Sporosarcina sp. ACRSM]MCG7337215.1 sigma 54-interacting transcriptional regulator [Sporosarcina sp. ACRSM]